MKNSKIKLSIQQFSLSDFLKEIYDIIQIQAQLKNLKFLIINNVGDLILLNDQRRLKQILLNFLSNGIKFTSTGAVTLSVSCTTLSNLYFQVSDTGSGISQECIAKLGIAYATFGTETNSNSNGIGLGLHLSKYLIGLLGPNEVFDVQSVIGEGTTFGFQIFQNFENQLMKNESIYEEVFSEEIDSMNEAVGKQFLTKFFTQNLSTLKNSDQQYQTPLKVLIVDDNVFNIFVLKAQLKKFLKHLKVQQCYNGQEAVNYFEKFNNSEETAFDLIFMDCDMPIMDGYQATQIITDKINSESLINCPIIGNSALVTEFEYNQCIACGMCDVLSKPVGQNILFSAVQTFLKLK